MVCLTYVVTASGFTKTGVVFTRSFVSHLSFARCMCGRVRVRVCVRVCVCVLGTGVSERTGDREDDKSSLCAYMARLQRMVMNDNDTVQAKTCVLHSHLLS